MIESGFPIPTGCSVQVACRVLAVSESGFYVQRQRPPSARAIRHAALTDLIARVHADSRGTYGARRVHAELVQGHGLVVGHGTVALLHGEWNYSLLPRQRLLAEAVVS